MKRRALLASALTACTGALAGCLNDSDDFDDSNSSNESDDTDDSNSSDGATDFDPATVDCESKVNRPDPEAIESDDTIDPFDYPDHPDSLSEEELFEYVEDFEEAYVGNDYIGSSAGNITAFSLGVSHSEIVSSGDDWAVVRAEYEYGYEANYDDDPIAAHSATIVTKYAVTENWVRRTVEEGHDAEPADPRESGTFVECLDE